MARVCECILNYVYVAEIIYLTKYLAFVVIVQVCG